MQPGVEMSAVNNLIAAELSLAAYTPIGDYQGSVGGGGSLSADEYLADPDSLTPLSTAVALPSGWSVDVANSGFTGNASDPTDQFLVFVNSNSATMQVVIAFRGTNSLSTLLFSDLYPPDQGASDYAALQPIAAAKLANIRNIYSKYQIVTDGHSLGGGMAQTFSLQYGLSGYGQNSLPIAPASISSFNLVRSGYKQSFSEVNVVGDPATSHYSGGIYLNANPTPLPPNPNLLDELGGPLGAAIPGATAIGLALAAYGALQAHSINTVINLLAGSSSSVSAQFASLLSTDSPTILSATESDQPVESQGELAGVSSNGATDDVTSTVINANQTDYTISGNGQPGVTLDVVAGALGAATELTVTAYSGPNNTGSVTGSAVDYTNGTSTITTYTPGGSTDAISYAGPNGTGNATSSVLSIANGDRVTASVNTPDETVTFAGPYGVLNLANPATFSGTISNFTNSASTTSDSINLAGISATGVTFGANNVLTVQTGTGAIDLQFASGQNLSGNEFTISPDGNGGTEVLLGRTYVYTGRPFTSSPDASPFTPGNVVLSVTVSPNIPANFTGEVNANGGGIVWWTASAYGQTISPANANNEQTSIFVTFANGTPTNWSFEVENFSTLPNFITFMDSGGKDGNLDDVQSSPKEGLTGTPGVWTIGVPPPGGDIVQTPTSLTTIAAGTTWTVSGNTSVANLVNNGTIVIPNGASLQVTSRLVEDAGSAITGVVTGAGASTTIELASGKSGSISTGLSNIGTIAVDAGASWTVTGSYSLPNIADYGTIVVGSGASLQVTSRLVEGAGSAITGIVAGAGAGTTVELAAGKSGSISSGLSNIGTIAIDAGASWTVTGSYSLPNIVDNGTIAIASGGSLDVFSALDPASTGIFQLQNSTTLELAAALGHSTQIQFLGSTNDKLVIDKAASFGAGVGTTSYAGSLVENFAAGDLIDLKGIASAGLTLNYSATSGDLQIAGSSGNALATLAFQNSTLGTGTFRVAADGFGGTLITHS
jgi:hypothetical protein